MKLNVFKKAAVGGAVAMTAATALIASTMVSASADPTRDYSATGSDTIQDVWNGLTNDFGAVAPSIASWNAFVVPPAGTAPGTYTSFIQTKTGGNWFLRPSGSGNGVKSLSAVWNPAADHKFPAGTGVVLNHEDVDFARSSSGPVAGTDLKFIPFGRDAVSIAYNTTGSLTGLNLTTTEIKELYNGIDDAADNVVKFYASDGTTQVATATADSVVKINGTVVHPKIPQNASGTRGFFLGAIGVTTAQLAPYIPVRDNTVDNGGLPENDGTVLANDGDLIPFSAAQWIAQSNGRSTNTTAGLSLASVNGLTPVTGTAGSLAPSDLYGAKNNLSGKYTTVPGTGVGVFNRDTYDVVPTSFLTGTSKQQALVSILGAGINGAAGASVISSYGFGVLAYAGNTANFRNGAFQ